MKIIVDSVGKYFGEKKIFTNLSFEVSSGKSVAIIGPNGSGKTTLLRIISGLINPTQGAVSYFENGEKLDRKKIFSRLGLVGPYLELYDELTAMENLRFFAKMKRLPDSDNKINNLLEKMHLAGRESDLVKNYSSGMKQRLKYVFALMSEPEILLLDEPTSNLDKEGINTVFEIMESQKSKNILIIATNDEADLKYGDRQIAVAS
jgi:heme exporter protein A